MPLFINGTNIAASLNVNSKLNTSLSNFHILNTAYGVNTSNNSFYTNTADKAESAIKSIEKEYVSGQEYKPLLSGTGPTNCNMTNVKVGFLSKNSSTMYIERANLKNINYGVVNSSNSYTEIQDTQIDARSGISDGCAVWADMNSSMFIGSGVSASNFSVSTTVGTNNTFRGTNFSFIAHGSSANNNNTAVDAPSETRVVDPSSLANSAITITKVGDIVGPID